MILQHLRLGSDTFEKSSVPSMSDASQGTFKLTNSSSSRGIMKVRTLKESLDGVNFVEMKRKRKNLKLSFHNEASRTMCNSNKLSTNRDKIVQFGHVTIREYPVIPGDNPSVLDGPPLTLDWTAITSFSVKINRFERFRAGNRPDMFQMKMPSHMRVRFLFEQ